MVKKAIEATPHLKLAEPSADTPLHLLQLEVSNFLKIKALTVKPNGRDLLVTGGNGTGKSSVLAAVFVLLKGWKSKDYPEPVNMGEDKAYIKGDFGAFIVDRHFGANGTTRLTVTAADGTVINSPQKLLDSFISTIALDPGEFISKPPAKQVATILEVKGIRPPVKEVEEITGRRFEPRPGDSASDYLDHLFNDENGVIYLERRGAGQGVDLKRHALEEERRVLESLGDADPDQSTSLSALAKEMERLQQKADERRAVMANATSLRSEHEDLVRQLRGVDAQCELETTAIKDIDRRIAELIARKETHVKNKAGLEARIAKGAQMVADADSEASAVEAAVEALEDPAPKILHLRSRMADYERGQQARVKRQVHQQRVEVLAADLEKELAAHKRLDDVITLGRQLWANILAGIDLGIAGLTVEHGELRLNGVSFRQASTAQRLDVACAVVCLQRPTIRLMRLDDGEHFDQECCDLVRRRAHEHGWQVLMTRVQEGNLTIGFFEEGDDQ